MYGGHRLWHAPEDPAYTYLPDDKPVEIKTLQNGIWVTQSVELETGIKKELIIRLVSGKAQVEVEHRLTNQGGKTIPCAAWAITQLKPGGIALLPQKQGPFAGNPTLPNRSLALWPYTDINNPYLSWGNQVALVQAEIPSNKGALKIGFPNPRGWLAYWLAGTLFIKRTIYNHQADYYDFGSSSECYCNDQFLELETLGPVTQLEPGQSLSHLEVWDILSGVEWTDDLDHLVDLIEKEREA
jgi:hypothetical protein